MAGFILDLLLIAMLGVMIFYVMRLHKRLEVIRSGRHDLESLLRDLVNSTASAERSLMDLRENAGALSQTLQKQITGAGRAREELEYLLASADKVADTLMDAVGKARTSAPSPSAGRELPREAPRAEFKETIAKMAKPQPASAPVLQSPLPTTAPVADMPAREAAESDLMRAIEKLR